MYGVTVPQKIYAPILVVWDCMHACNLMCKHCYLDAQTELPNELNLTGLLLSVFRKGTWESLVEFHNSSLFLGIMHFQDLYNMDLERLQRCGIHYVLPDGRRIPFCSYNTVHRSLLSGKSNCKLQGVRFKIKLWKDTPLQASSNH
ncbi:MAG: hypothetical protein WB392_08030 [Methanotrichaceae archaeon]